MRLARDVTLLRANGHLEAVRYTPWKISLEAALVREYLGGQQAHLAALVSAAIGAALDQKSARSFGEVIADLLNPD